MLVAASGLTGARSDGEVDLEYLGAPRARPREAEAWLTLAGEMQAALGKDRPKGGQGRLVERARDRAMELRFPPCASAVRVVAEADPDVIVLSPSAEPTARLLRAAVGDATRMALLVGSSSSADGVRAVVDRDLPDGVSTVLVASDPDGLAGAQSHCQVVGLPFWAGTGETPLAAEMRDEGPYVVALADWPPWRELLWPSVLGRALLGHLGDIGVVFVGKTGVVLWRRGQPVVAYGPLERAQLWDITSGAECLVDLRVPAELDREVLEAMLLGTAVVVPGNRSRSAREESPSGRLTYRSGSELVEAVQLLHGDPVAKKEVAAEGRSRAEQVCVGPERFAGSLVAALGGAGGALPG